MLPSHGAWVIEIIHDVMTSRLSSRAAGWGNKCLYLVCGRQALTQGDLPSWLYTTDCCALSIIGPKGRNGALMDMATSDCNTYVP